MDQPQSTTPIVRSRGYQDEALAVAKRRNTILRLPTGSGKTHVACMLTRDIFLQPSPAEAGQKKKIVIFLVEKVLLGQQHVETLKTFFSSASSPGSSTLVNEAKKNKNPQEGNSDTDTDMTKESEEKLQSSEGIGKLSDLDNLDLNQDGLVIRGYFGRSCDQDWDAVRWRKEFESIDIGVMTAQIFYNRLRGADITISQISLLVFDEAHHAKKNHMYVQIMKDSYYPRKQANLTAATNGIPEQHIPKILGLTASPIYQINKDKAQKELRELERNLDSRLYEIQYNVDEIRAYAPLPVESIEHFNDPDLSGDPCLDLFKDEGVQDATNQLTQTERILMECEWAWQIAKADSRTRLGWIKAKTELGALAADLYLYSWLTDISEYFYLYKGLGDIRQDPTKLSELKRLRDAVGECLELVILRDGQKLMGSRDIEMETEIQPKENDLEGFVVGMKRQRDQYEDMESENVQGTQRKEMKPSDPFTTAREPFLTLLPNTTVSSEALTQGHPSEINSTTTFGTIFSPGFCPVRSLYPSSTTITTSKVSTLLHLLARHGRVLNNKFRGIIFGETRMHCQIVSQIIELIRMAAEQNPGQVHLEGLRRIRCGYLVGHGSTQGGGEATNVEVDMKINEQFETLCKFRKGELNLLVATKIAEEGLDIPSCNLVIRFDFPPTIISYVQSRGRARSRLSNYVLLAQQDSVFVDKWENYRVREKELLEEYAARADEEETDDFDEEDDEFRFVVEGSGAFFTAASAISLLETVCGKLPKDGLLPDPKPYFFEECNNGGFSYGLTLPLMQCLTAKERNFVGPTLKSKPIAKGAVAFEACRFLLQRGILDDTLRPAFDWCRKDLPAINVDGAAVDQSKVPPFVCGNAINPFGNIWDESTPVWMNHIEVTLHNHQKNSSVSFDCGFLCAASLQVEETQFSDGEDEVIWKLNPASSPLQWSTAERDLKLQALEAFNQTCLMAALNRRFKAKRTRAPLLYFFAPLLTDTREVDWDVVNGPLEPIVDSNTLAEGSTLITPHSILHQRVYTFRRHRPDISSSSPFQLPVKRKHSSKHQTFAEFFNNPKIRYFTGLESDAFGEAFIEAEARPQARKHFSVSDYDIPGGNKKLVTLPLAMCWKTFVSPTLLDLFRYFPMISRTIHDHARARHAITHLSLPNLPLPMMVEAITLPSSFIGHDYERLECLGDSIAKLFVSVHVYVSQPGWDQAVMSTRRQHSINNLCFRKKGIAANLPDLMLSHQFQWLHWTPIPISTATGDGGLEEGSSHYTQRIARRCCSDVFEAILGAAYLHAGFKGAEVAGKALKLSFGDNIAWSSRVPALEDFPTPTLLAPLEKRLGHSFNDSRILTRAITHRTCIAEDSCYEREEFLGDAIIDVFVLEHIFRRFPKVAPSTLTVLKSVLVCNTTLATLSLELFEVHKHLRFSAESSLSVTLEQVFQEAKAKDWTSKERLTRDPWTWDVPKILGDSFEALVAAIFIDSGYDIQYIFSHLEKYFAKPFALLREDLEGNPWGTYRRYLDRLGCKNHSIEYSPFAPGRPREAKIKFHEREIGIGINFKKSTAKHQAAEKALAAFCYCPKDLNLDVYLPATGLAGLCDCPTNRRAKREVQHADVEVNTEIPNEKYTGERNEGIEASPSDFDMHDIGDEEEEEEEEGDVEEESESEDEVEENSASQS